MSNEEDLTPQDLAKKWRIKAETLAVWRMRGQGPEYYKIGEGQFARVRYKLSDVMAYEKKAT